MASEINTLLNESLIPLDAARDEFPGRPSRASLDRYRKQGALGCLRSAGRLWTSREACRRAIARLSQPEEIPAGV